jgi:site-specific DNA recombinase
LERAALLGPRGEEAREEVTTSIKRRAARPETTLKRVGIYTRKSTEDGLDQEFNSLDAQRESVEAYIQSHQAEGWVALPDRYDDGGFTGANTDRPAFKRLLQDIEAGKVDVVGVYKMDRLSRSLLDFLQVMEHFRKHGVTFVAVTQRIDTSGSMGEFVSNLFAALGQLERRMISERTSDKMRAARRKGLWMGGFAPLGYDAVDGRLVVNEGEAEQVRTIFRVFAETGSVVQTLERLDELGLLMKPLPGKNGRALPERSFTTTSLRRILANVTYRGKTAPGGMLHDGAHESIIDEVTWDTVQGLVAGRRQEQTRRRSKSEALLQGLVRCGACGSAMTARYSSKKGRKYWYYSCLKLIKGGAAACPGSHVPARVLEAKVVEQIRAIGRDPQLLDEVVRQMERELAEKRPELEGNLREVQQERERLEREQKRLVGAVADAQGGRKAIVAELGELAVALESKEAEEARLRAELEALAAGAVDRKDLRQALEEFEELWEDLFPGERARMLGLLVIEVQYEARQGEVRLRFRPGEVQNQ